MNTPRSTFPMTLALTASLGAYAQQPRGPDAAEPAPAPSAWKVQAGWVHQWGRGMSIQGPAPSFGLHTPGARQGRPGMTYPDNSALIPRTFDDGYVRPDRWSGDLGLLDGPNPERFALTWNWGAENAAQYDYDGGAHPTLTFRIDRGTHAGPVSAPSGPSRVEDDLSSDGLEVKASRLLRAWKGKSGDLDLNISIGLAAFHDDELSFRSFVDQRLYRDRETYTYLDYYGVTTAPGGPWPPLELPYAGGYGTTDTAAGPLIPLRPESSSRQSSLAGTYRNEMEIRGELSRVRALVGPDVVLPLGGRVRVFVSPQLALEFLDMTIVRTESVSFARGSAGTPATIASGNQRDEKSDVVPGLLLTAGADVELTEQWFAGASLGWEWLGANPSVRMGPNRVDYDLDGGEFSLFLGRRF